MSGRNRIRSFALFDPLLESRQHVEAGRTVAAAAMTHAGNHEQPVIVFYLAESAHRVQHTLVVLDAAPGWNLLIRPAVVLNHLAAACKEGLQVRVPGVDL